MAAIEQVIVLDDDDESSAPAERQAGPSRRNRAQVPVLLSSAAEHRSVGRSSALFVYYRHSAAQPEQCLDSVGSAQMPAHLLPRATSDYAFLDCVRLCRHRPR